MSWRRVVIGSLVAGVLITGWTTAIDAASPDWSWSTGDVVRDAVVYTVVMAVALTASALWPRRRQRAKQA